MAKIDVAPLVGAWIEIQKIIEKHKVTKYAPVVGAWIEMSMLDVLDFVLHVAPLVGAWIEMKKAFLKAPKKPSLPSWERGLKYLPA